MRHFATVPFIKGIIVYAKFLHLKVRDTEKNYSRRAYQYDNVLLSNFLLEFGARKDV